MEEASWIPWRKRIILNRFLEYRMVEDCIHMNGVRGILAGCFEHVNELLRNV